MNYQLNIKFNDYGFLKDLLLENYNRYIRYKNFRNELLDSVIVINNNESFFTETFTFNDLENINKINNSIVFIDAIAAGLNLKKYFEQYNKSNFYIIFSTSIWQKEKYALNNLDYIVLDFYLFVRNILQSSSTPQNENFYYSKEYKFDYPKNIIFVSTTGEERTERNYLVKNLVKKIDYDNFILKYQTKNLGKNFDHLDFHSMNYNNYSIDKCLLGDNNTISSIIPIDLYNQAYFNLVVESLIDYPYSFMPTEKIAKVLLTGIPFVVYSTPRFLQNLHKLGFTTYNELWNEDYDLEFDYTKRADMIVDLCNKLEHFDWQKHKEKLQEIANKNASAFLKNNSHVLDQMKKIYKTLEIIKDKDAQYLKNNPQLFEWLDNNTV